MNKNWIIGIVVVAAVGLLVYLGTNTDLFKGALDGEKGGLPTVTEARCKMIIQKLNTQGLLSADWKYYDSCLNNYPALFTTTVDTYTCQLLKKLIDEGNLSKNSINLAKAHMCAKDYPSIWYGFASLQSCKKIQQWLNESKITSGAYFDEKLECAGKYPDLYDSWKLSTEKSN